MFYSIDMSMKDAYVMVEEIKKLLQEYDKTGLVTPYSDSSENECQATALGIIIEGEGKQKKDIRRRMRRDIEELINVYEEEGGLGWRHRI